MTLAGLLTGFIVLTLAVAGGLALFLRRRMLAGRSGPAADAVAGGTTPPTTGEEK